MNQLSGGQMQRVAIARALVNNPEIILADEPTGALDSYASVQLMEILKEISKTRLVIMVTHNAELADKYSSRIIRLLDGEVQSDSNPLLKDKESKKEVKKLQPVDKKVLKKTSMSMKTAGTLSFMNLLTKKGRTITTAFAASIGIIGVALVLALSTGFSDYMTQIQTESLAGMPITINEAPQTIDTGWQNWQNQHGEIPLLSRPDESGMFTEDNVLYRHDSQTNSIEHRNVLTQEYFDYIASIKSVLPDAVNSVSYSRALGINLLYKGEDSVIKYETIAYSNIGAFFSIINKTTRHKYNVDMEKCTKCRACEKSCKMDIVPG